MTTPLDLFAQSFDTINVDPARAPSATAIDQALAACAYDQPGFYLEDDAAGRFVVDREFGVISLSDDSAIESLRDQVFSVRLRVVEGSGESYQLDMKLRVTGVVPQMLGAEDFGLGAVGETPASAPAAPDVPWTAFAAARGLQTKPALRIDGAYGTLLDAALPASTERVTIAFAEPLPAAAPRHAAWSL